MSKQASLSVFFPAYNEEKNIKNTVLSALKILPRLVGEYEVVVVDDGSEDKTKEIVEKIVKKNPKVRIVAHKKNRGYGASLKSGLYSAKFPLIAFTDADGQFDFAEIRKFLDGIGNADLVIGYREKRAEGWGRVVNAKGWAFLNRVLFGLNVKDVDCGFKLIRKKVIDTIPRLESEGAMVSAELLIKANKMGYRIKEFPVSHRSRLAGEQSGANIKVILKAFRELFRLYPKLKLAS